MRREAVEAMAPFLTDQFANPSGAHAAARAARKAVDEARDVMAEVLGCQPGEVVFTSGGTEGDHVALIGAAWAAEPRGRRIAISALEHHAIHGAAAVLERLGWAVEHLPADADGRIDPAAIESLPTDTTVVAVMLANNETGVIQPLAEIARRATARGLRVVCDAVQAAGKIPVRRETLDADYLVISGHKFGGPKGAGALIVGAAAPLEPLFRGSAQERGRRGGTENLPGIVALGAAAAAAARDLEAEHQRLLELRARLESGVRAALPDAVVHGAAAPRLPNTVNLSIPGARSDHMLMALDARGVAVSAGAACASGAVEPSPVLSAMGVPRELAVCALRLSMGRDTTAAEVDAVVEALTAAATMARAVTAGAR